ncbi:MAG TPA: hydantoinase/oxoprolinase family protein [Syntrophorhabdales bacterium]|nr:hydantoinase/oxoprolinase family protein [Syntrophorhabdales bacterium]
MSFRIAIDTGGTFTDSISVDGKGNLVTTKTLTVPRNLARGTINAVDALAKKNDLSRKKFLQDVETVVHGTTQGTNVIITRTGPKLGIIATEGHADVLQLRRVIRDNIYDWRKPFPEPLVPRYLRVGVKERVDSQGKVVRQLDEEGVRRAVAYLKSMKVDSVVVALLWSFLYPEHERAVAEIIRKDFPEAHVTLSHKVLPAIGEYERTSTAVINAYTAPSTAAYIRTLTDFLTKEDFQGQFLFMQNNGGVETAEIGIENPASLATSGPAAGPSAALAVGRLHGLRNLLSVDMGGTSFDIAIIDQGKFITRTESLISDHRFSLPIIDVDSVGAGGGSIAWFDATNTLRVGPKSAGADPGPACYGLGGEEATVTDADVILGYISPDFFLGGEMPLKKDLAEKAVKRIADQLGMSVVEAAAAIYKVSNSVMADAVSHTFTKRGYDPRVFALVAGGAAGPTCALKIAQELYISKVIVPKYAPIYCAFGMLDVDLIHDFTRFYHADKSTFDLNRVKSLYKEMENEALEVLKREEIPVKDRVLERTMRVKYWGQFRDVEVSWPRGPITNATVAAGITNFHRRHKELYGSSDKSYPIEFMGFGLRAIGRMPKLKLKKLQKGDRNPRAALKGERVAFFEENRGFVKTKIYDGDKLRFGNVLEGPCIVEEKMTNVVIPPKFKLRVDQYGNYITA